MNVHFLFLGSAGDFFPFLRIGLEMRARGHNVTIAGNDWAGHFVSMTGVNFVPIKAEVEGFDPSNDDMVSDLVIGDIPSLYDYVMDNYVENETLFVSCFGYFGVKLAAEKLNINIVNVLYSPHYINEPIGFDAARTNLYLTDRLNSEREKIGLPKLTKPVSEWIIDNPNKFAVYPEWFEKNAVSETTLHVGFPLPEQSFDPLPEPLEHFLSKDSRKTIIFTPGTPLPNTQSSIDPVIEAVTQLDIKCIFVFRHKPGDTVSLPAAENIFHLELMPFEQLLHRVDLLIHHGGVGTLAEAMRAGIPQIVKPMYWDQFDNGKLVESAGVGKTITQKEFTSQVLIDVIPQLLQSEAVVDACQRYKSAVVSENGVLNAADFLCSFMVDDVKQDVSQFAVNAIPEIA